MLFCFIDTDSNLFFIKNEIACCRENNNGCFYDQTRDCFLDFNGNVIDVMDQIVFPRSGVLQVPIINDAIERMGGISIATNSENATVTDWPKFYETERRVWIVKGEDLVNEEYIEHIEKIFGTEIFFKTKEKNYSSLIRTEYLKDKDSLLFRTLLEHLDEEFIISEKVNICSDNLGKKQYRCFVYNRQVMNISRTTDTILHEVDPIIYSKTIRILKELFFTDFSMNYVVDLFEYEDGFGNRIVDAVEFNDICSSGTFLYNTVLESSPTDILHQDKRKLPIEKVHMLRECLEDGEIRDIPSINYEVKNSFAYDLKSIYMTGRKGSWVRWELPKDIREELLGMHGSYLNLASLKPFDPDSGNKKKGPIS